MVHSSGDVQADERSPAERHTAAQARRKWPELTSFAEDYPFALDDFQIRACRVLEDGHGVLVCAPTGAGKTVVGEFAVHLALAEDAKCFYTTPIKALSNQKFNDLVDAHGAENVGLLTGDTVINGEAPIVVMTTEVLRNMIYAGSPTLGGLRYVVMDEVHYLADRFRGAVWEEIIIELPERVRVVSLSATVSNAEEFGDWLKSVRGSTEVVVSETRPVPLWQHMMVGGVLLDLFEPDGDYVNKELLKKDARARERSERSGGGRRRGRPYVDRGRVVSRLDSAALLPAIYFIFSRAGCDAAVDECVRAGLRLTDGADRDAIIDHATAACAHIDPRDLEAVGFDRWLDGLAAGFAAHHAGLLPVFKEVVEKLFERGLLKVVFATETLALGINMPARSVVLERLIKYDGTDHVMLTPGQYTQLTGRAGRRGIDVEGHAVTVWADDIRPKEVAGLASKRTYPLNSSFAPSYNMSVNLINAAGVARAEEVLASSFAQFQSDTEAVHLAEQARALSRKAAESAGAAKCDKGDFLAYFEVTQRLSQAERGAQKRRKGSLRDAARTSLEKLRGGDVVWISRGKRSGWAVFLRASGRGRHDLRWAVVTDDGWTGSLDSTAFDGGVEVVTRVRLPKHFNRKDVKHRNDLAAQLREATRDRSRPTRRGGAAETPEIARLREEVRDNPCRDCPDAGQHTVHASRWLRLKREVEHLKSRAGQREHSLARQFTAVREVLSEFGYLEGETVTDSGRLLRNIFCETDLLVAQCLRDGIWEGLEAPALAAIASTVIYESRFEEDEYFVAIPGPITDAVAATGRRWEAIRRAENSRGLSLISKPQLGLAWPMYRWSRGEELSKALAAADGPWPMPGGDFVRWARRTADLLHQMGTAARVIGTKGSNKLADEAFDAVDAIRRGVVADV
ncbi:DEAD/DEAH box helicase [Glycomyces buryatensis]|uniref:DEAD/DEAH box helicase n=1 Tax=Glycomyces buryatensis TaxID=2570927 RepID=A0A4V4HQD6_9ACTN|nr:DEAD/DEAH box helicase [Glycomyces buryatensis]THV33396.1 DEAD/DEAH box helicase [Glycomyces buryatensis]